VTACANPRFLRPLLPGLSWLSLPAATEAGFPDLRDLPRSLKVVAEDLLWRLPEDEARAALARLAARDPAQVLSLAPGRALLQDFLGIPLMTDLASMRDLLAEAGRDPALVDPAIPVDFVVDHSLTAFHTGTAQAMALNRATELDRNRERFAFIKWCQSAFGRFRVIPPGRGIMHQVNLEWLASVVRVVDGVARPDTMIGTDSHTTMVNALGVLGWGVGGIEAEMAMLGLPIEFRAPRVVGIRLDGALAPGVTATDLVLHMAEFLRGIGVVGDFVEFFGDGVARLPLADRATIANMAPEYGATCAHFPIDAATLDYLGMTGRDPAHLARIEAYARAQGLWQDAGQEPPVFDALQGFDLGAVAPCMAGPTRPDQRVPLSAVPATLAARARELGRAEPAPEQGLHDGAVVIAAITSCTNTSNPGLMLTAGLLARNAVARGLAPKPWVKTSLAPGSRVVTDYLDAAGLSPALDALGFQTIGYGCTTCNGNSGPLAADIAAEIEGRGLMTVGVLSGNRNFEGRIHPQIKAAYLASPPLVIAAALAGTLARDLATEPLGHDPQGRPVFLAEIWPDPAEVAALVAAHATPAQFARSYGSGMDTTPDWAALPAPTGQRFPWDPDSTFIRPSPFPALAAESAPLAGLRTLLALGDRITTDHISPNGAIRADSPAGQHLLAAGVPAGKLGNFGLRRGNAEVCALGMFDNALLRNALAAPALGNLTRTAPGAPPVPVSEAAAAHRAAGRGTIIVAGRDYGAGSSRDWAAKGLRLLGVRAVLAQGFERIHRSNLVGMGVLPLVPDDGAALPPLDGAESWDIDLPAGLAPQAPVAIRLRTGDGTLHRVAARLDLHSPAEAALLAGGGVLPSILARLAAA
jgi:aconitate hydratase